MPKDLKKPICRFISAGVTCSSEYRSLSVEGPSRLLFLFMLIHPHGSFFHVPGLYKVGPEALRETCGLPRRAFTRAFTELRERHIVQSDQEVQLLWMPSALYLMGPPANPNMVKGYCRSISQLPSCDLLDAAIQFYRKFLSQLGPSFVQPFEDAFCNPAETVALDASEPFANGFTGVRETYSHSDKNRNRNTYNQNKHDVNGSTGASICGFSCASIAQELDWPNLTEANYRSYIEQLPPLSRSDVLQAKAAVLGKPEVREPWAYFFAVLKRKPSTGSMHQTVASAGDHSDPFAAYADGEVVTFND